MAATSLSSSPVTVKTGSRSRFSGCGLMVFIALGLLGVAAVGIDWVRSLETWSWEETTCQVKSSAAIERPESGDYLFQVDYAYRWGSLEWSGSIYSSDYFGSEEGPARVLASRYPAGTVVPCFVDPEDPSQSALVRDDLWKGLLILVPLLFVAIGFGGLRFLRSLEIFEKPALKANPEAPFRSAPPIGQTIPRAEGAREFNKSGFAAAFFGLFFLVGAIIFVPLFVWPAFKVIEARSWDEVPCEILESSIRAHSSDDGTTYSIEVLFSYEVDGRQLLSDRYHFLSGSTGGYKGKDEVVDQIPPGTRTFCYVDPEDPYRAVLKRGFTGEFLAGLIPLIFVVVGAGGVIVVISTARSARRAAAGPSWAGPAVPEESGQSRGAVTLEPGFGRFGRLVAAGFFTLFWNGVVSVFVWQLVEGWRAGHVDWVLALFLTPFVLIGLLLAAGIPLSIMALANPRPRLRLSRSALHPGESAQIDWSFRGAAGRIRQFTIELHGSREVDASDLSDDSPSPVESEPTRIIEIASRNRGMGLELGSASFTIPEEPSAGSKITWKLVLHGDIAFWPDVHDEYKLTVLD